MNQGKCANSLDMCPQCRRENNLICDNSCGTSSCQTCHLDWYFTVKDGVYHRVIGHAPNCGED